MRASAESDWMRANVVSNCNESRNYGCGCWILRDGAPHAAKRRRKVRTVTNRFITSLTSATPRSLRCRLTDCA